MTASHNLPRLAVAIAIIALPFFAYLEHKHNDIFTNRLAFPQIIQQPNLHTPVHTDGIYLPPVINKAVTYAASQSPLLLNGTLTITSQGSLTIEPGVTIYTAENSQIINQGHLTITGSKEKPVTLASNEANQANQTWGGIITSGSAQTTIQNVAIQDASPAISCLNNSQVAMSNLHIIRGNLGIYNESTNCSIKDSSLAAVRDGIINIMNKAQTSNVTIAATHQSEQTIHQ